MAPESKIRAAGTLAASAFLILVALSASPPAAALQMQAPEYDPDSGSVEVVVDLDPEDTAAIQRVRLHFDCTAAPGGLTSGFFTEELAFAVGASSEHATLADIDAAGAGYGYGYFQARETGYGPDGTPSPAGLGYGYGYGYGFQTGRVVLTFELIRGAFEKNESCTLVVELDLADGDGGSIRGDYYSPRSASFTPRIPPTVSVASQADVPEGTRVTLLATAGDDGEPGPLTFAWTQVTTLAVSDPAGATTASFSVTMPNVAAAGATATFRVTVGDTLDTASADVTFRVLDLALPTVQATAAPFALEGRTHTLSGTVTTPGGASATYAWTSDFAGLAITGADQEDASFVAPAVAADTPITFTLTATVDGTSVSDTAVVTVVNNRAPTADAAAPGSIAEGLPLTLDGTAADLDVPLGDSLTYAWRQTAPMVLVLGTGLASPDLALVAPAVATATAHTYEFTATDLLGATATDTVTVIVLDGMPEADAGPAQRVYDGANVSLDARGSFDPQDGRALTFAWTGPAGVSLQQAGSARPWFIAPEMPAGSPPQTLTFQLTVADQHGNVDTDQTTVVVRNDEGRPAATEDYWLRSTCLVDGFGLDPDAMPPLVEAPDTAPGADDGQDTGDCLRVTLALPSADELPTDDLPTDDLPTESLTGTPSPTLPPLPTGTPTVPPLPTTTPSVPTTTPSVPTGVPTVPAAMSMHSDVPLADGHEDFTAVPPVVDVPAGTPVEGTLYMSFLLPPEAESTVTVELVDGDGQVVGSQDLGTPDHAAAFGLVPPGGDGPEIQYEALPLDFTLAEPLEAGETFTFRVTVTPLLADAYLVGVDGDHASSFRFDVPAVPPETAVPPALTVGPTQTVHPGNPVTLLGTSATGAVTWYQVGGAPVALGGSGGVRTFTAPLALGDLRFAAIADDGTLTSALGETLVKVVAKPNALPVPTLAALPTSGTVPLTVAFTLGATDTDGTVTSHSIAFGDGTVQTGTGLPPAALTHTYTTVGSRTATLTVLDNQGGQGTASVAITVGPNVPNGLPVADARGPSTVVEGRSALLDGTHSSDPEGGALTYRWSYLRPGPVAHMSGPQFGQVTASVGATQPSPIGVACYRDSDSDTTFDATEPVYLLGGACTTAPVGAVRLANAATGGAGSRVVSADPDFGVALRAFPAGAGQLRLLDDGDGALDPADLLVLKTRTGLDALEVGDVVAAGAGAGQSIAPGHPGIGATLLAATPSFVFADADGDGVHDLAEALLVAGVGVTSGPAVEFAGTTTATPSFTAPQVDGPTPLTFRLTVRDPLGATATDDVTVTIVDQRIVPPPPQDPCLGGGCEDGSSSSTSSSGSQAPPTTTQGVTRTSTSATSTTSSSGTSSSAGPRPGFDLTHTLRVVRINNANYLDWDDPGFTPLGYQIWSSNSPYVLLAVTDGSKTDYEDPMGDEDTVYKVTYFTGHDAEHGFFLTVRDALAVFGWEEAVDPDGEDGGDEGGNGIPAPAAWVLLAALGAAAWVARRRLP